MARVPVWKSIAAALEREIAAGHYRPGDKLPTEAEMAARFGVNRHTVRRALGDMAERGILRSRRGAGVFVEAPVTDYPLGRRVRFHQNVAATGRLPEKRRLRLETRPADEAEAEALRLERGDPVVVYEGLSLADGAPLSLFMSVFPSHRFPDLMATLSEVTSVTEALCRSGVADYLRAETRITAERASATQALHLRIREDEPLLHSISVNTDLEGRPIERGSTWFAGDRVAFTVNPD